MPDLMLLNKKNLYYFSFHLGKKILRRKKMSIFKLGTYVYQVSERDWRPHITIKSEEICLEIKVLYIFTLLDTEGIRAVPSQ